MHCCNCCHWINPPYLNSHRAELGDILRSHRESLIPVNSDNTRRITVRRSRLLDDTVKSLKIRAWNPSTSLKVTFLGEPGVDDGGPRREFFRLLLPEISKNNFLFQGPLSARIPCHNVLAVQERMYFYVGQILALSMLHDGPGFHCLAPTVVHYILGDYTHGPSWEDIPDMTTQQKMKQVCCMCA